MDVFLPVLFRMLHTNMSAIAPTGNTYEADWELWRSQVGPALEKTPRQIVLMYAGDTLAGYFQYYINEATNSLMMEEIQIEKVYQQTGLFSAFYRWLVKQLPVTIDGVEAYAHKDNHKSQAILNHLGLTRQGENKGGNSFYYKGNYANLRKRYTMEETK